MNVTFPDGLTRTVGGVIERPASPGADRDEWDRLVAHCNPTLPAWVWEGPGYSSTTPPSPSLPSPALEWGGLRTPTEMIADIEARDAYDTMVFNDRIARGSCGHLLVYSVPSASTVRFLTHDGELRAEALATRTHHFNDPVAVPSGDYNINTSTPRTLSSDWIPLYHYEGGVAVLSGYRRVVGGWGAPDAAHVSTHEGTSRPFYDVQLGQWRVRQRHASIHASVTPPTITFTVTNVAPSVGVNVLAPWMGNETAVGALWRAAVMA